MKWIVRHLYWLAVITVTPATGKTLTWFVCFFFLHLFHCRLFALCWILSRQTLSIEFMNHCRSMWCNLLRSLFCFFHFVLDQTFWRCWRVLAQKIWGSDCMLKSLTCKNFRLHGMLRCLWCIYMFKCGNSYIQFGRIIEMPRHFCMFVLLLVDGIWKPYEMLTAHRTKENVCTKFENIQTPTQTQTQQQH